MDEQHLKEPGVCRVFLSSPFRGMEKEREEFTKRYWPQVDAFCKSKGVQFVPVDMRWGITEERQQVHQTVLICLREIDRSDIFVGFYAQRYGWHGVDDETLQKNLNIACQAYPWVDRFRSKSVTELEFLHGHLNNPGAKPAVVCFRKKDYDEECKAGATAKGDSNTAKKYMVENEKAAKLMTDLKIRVKASQSKCLASEMEYATPEEGAKLIFDAVWKYLTETLLKDKAQRSQLEQQLESHSSECKTACTTYVVNDVLMKKLDSHLLQDSGLLLVTGGRGSGKTTLLGNWILQQTRKDKLTLLYHFVNCTAESASVHNILLRIVTSLLFESMKDNTEDKAGLWTELENTYMAFNEARLAAVWVELMDMYSQKGQKVLIVLAGLDKITYQGHEKIVQVLHWLPTSFPKGCYFVVSTNTDDKKHLDCLREKFKYKELVMEPLSLQQKLGICKKALGLRGKELTDKQTKTIVDANGANNPLFLTVALEELCVFGDFRGLDAKVRSLADCKSAGDLFDKYLERLEKDYNYSDSLVQQVTCALYASRLGLQETELLEMFGIPQNHWLPLFYGLADFLISRRGFLRIAYYDLEQAVYRRYIKSTDKVKQLTGEQLSYYLSVIEQHTGKALPHHLLKETLWAAYKSENRRVMENILTTPSYFKYLIENGRSAYVFEYLQWLGHDEKSIVYFYHKKFEKRCEEEASGNAVVTLVENLWVLYEFLVFAQFLIAQEKTLLALKDIVETNPKVNLLKHKLKVYMYLSQTYAEQMKIDESLSMCKTFVELVSNGGDEVAVDVMQMKAKVCHTMGLAFVQKENFREAEEMLRSAMVINRRLKHGKTELINIKQSQKLLAEIQFKQGRFKDSADMYEEVIDVEEKLASGLLSMEMSNTYICLSQCYRKMDMLEKAQQCLDKAMDMKKAVLGENHREMAIAYFNVANLCEDRGDMKGMIDNLEKAIEIHKFLGEDVCDSHNMLICYDNLIMAQIKSDMVAVAYKTYFSIFPAIQKNFDFFFKFNHDMVYRHACKFEKAAEAIKIMGLLSVSKHAEPEHFILIHQMVKDKHVKKTQLTVEMSLDAALQRFPESEELVLAKLETDLIASQDASGINCLLSKLFDHLKDDQARIVCTSADMCGQWGAGLRSILEYWRNELEDNELVLRKLAMLYYEAEDLKNASDCFQEASKVNPNDWQLQDKLVLMLLMQGRIAEANTELKKMKDKFKSDQDAMTKVKTYEQQMEQMRAHVQRRLSNKSQNN